MINQIDFKNMEKMEFDETDIKYEDIKIVEVGGMKVKRFLSSEL